MISRFFMKYVEDDEAWYWMLLTFFGFMLRSPNIWVLLVSLYLIYITCIMIAVLFVADLILSYLWGLYKKHAMGRTRIAALLHGSLFAFLITWWLSFLLYDQQRIGWDVHKLILMWSSVLFVCLLMGVDWYVGRRGQPDSQASPVRPSLNVRDYLRWNKKQPTK